MASVPPRPAGFPDPSTAGTVITGMSGGVDSAVSAWLLLQWGYAVQGLFMANWDDDDGYCTTADDYQDARRVCAQLGIPLHRVSFAAEYRQRVFDHFLREHAAGRTPNPDVLCNRDIKFGVCLTHARRLGGDWLATGHYARVEHAAGRSRLLKGSDPDKDQSYFLHAVTAGALRHTLMPVGALRKREVRALAHAAGLAVHDKPDSTGICFIGERPFADFLARYIAATPGPIETLDGRVVGEHRGLSFQTIGQRGGLGIGGRAGAAQAPWFVADKDLARNALLVVQRADHPRLMSRHFGVADPHWLGAAPADGASLQVRTRYRQADLDCHVESRGDGGWRVHLARAARAVTPGQYAVFYDGAECLGGGVIAWRQTLDDAPAERAFDYNPVISAEGS